MLEPDKKFFFNHHLFGCSPVFPCDNCKVVNFLKRKLGDEGFGELHDEVLGLGSNTSKQPIEPVPGDTLLSSIELPYRVYNNLRLENILTVEEVCSKARSELRKIRNFGKGSVDWLEKALKQAGWKLQKN